MRNFVKVSGIVFLFIIFSLFFYAYWKPVYLALLVSSIIFNYILGKYLLKTKSRHYLALGIFINLLILGYFKYFNFFISNFTYIVNFQHETSTIILPLAISFFTFQQIAYLVDIHKGKVKECNLLNYTMFVTFFPQLIAGPIVHHKEFIPQIQNLKKYKIEFLTVGLSYFIIGLSKKVLIADNLSILVTHIFNHAELENGITFVNSWLGAIGYTFQLYFDFSGYADMAIGIAYMFGIKLPINFNSPYKSKNIIEFWRNWHITLSRFLKDYLYIPLGGNRKGPHRRYVNLLITMVLGGLWHGAAWTFVLWGTLHGIYLIINHFWKTIKCHITFFDIISKASIPITFISVVVGWVFFRADSFDGSIYILRSMFMMNGFETDLNIGKIGSLNVIISLIIFIIAFIIAFFAPNTQQIFSDFECNIIDNQLGETRIKWEPNIRCALILSILAISSLLFILRSSNSEFLYFNF